MTAVNTIRTDQGFLVMVDGALFDANLVLHKFALKAFPLPHLGAVITGRCVEAILMDVFMTLQSHASSFDHALIAMPKLCKLVRDNVVKIIGGLDQRSEIVFVGWSNDRQRFERWLITHDPMTSNDWQMTCQAEPIWVAPRPSDEAMTKAGFETPELQDFDAVKHGIPLMLAQRATDGGIGGFIQAIWLTRDDIRAAIIHRWPDKPGQSLKQGEC